MRCKCGFHFSAEVMLESPRKFNSYALVHNAHYAAFLKSELAVLRAKKAEKTKAIARSSEHIGVLMECPKCSRLVWVRQDKGETEFYLKDE